RMVEDVEKLAVQAQLDVLSERKEFGEVEVAPNKLRTSQRVASQIPELAILRTVPAQARARAGVNGGDKGVGIQPLHRARLGHAGNRVMIVERHARDHACKLQPAALQDSVPIRGIRRAQHGKGQPAMPYCGSGYLPAVQRVAQPAAAHMTRELVGVLTR